MSTCIVCGGQTWNGRALEPAPRATRCGSFWRDFSKLEAVFS